ncbi:MAG: rod shape-determining protein RodA, partial [Bacteroidales bacterium]
METGKSIYIAADKSLICVFIILVLMGWFNIYAAVYDEMHQSIFDLSMRYGKQMLFISFAFVIALVVMLIDIRFFTQFSYIFYGISILGLLAVLVIGTEIAGNKSWIQLGGFSIQPSEFAKFATCLAFAKYVSSPEVNMKRVSSQIVASLWFLLPMILIMLQPDAGSALVYTAFVLVLYREGMSGNVLLMGGTAI